jgi:hypothetical protein
MTAAAACLITVAQYTRFRAIDFSLAASRHTIRFKRNSLWRLMAMSLCAMEPILVPDLVRPRRRRRTLRTRQTRHVCTASRVMRKADAMGILSLLPADRQEMRAKRRHEIGVVFPDGRAYFTSMDCRKR